MRCYNFGNLLKIYAMRYRILHKTIRILSILFLALLTACSTDEIDEVVTDETDTESTDNTDDTDNSDDTDEPEVETPEPETPDPQNPTTGAISFEENFVLNEERSFTNFVLPTAEYNKFITGDGDLRLISNKVYEYLTDDFDYIIILSVESSQPDGLFFGRSSSVSNSVEGLGGSTFDNTASYGSEGRLKSIIYMPRVEYVRNGPFLHEIAHTWANKNFLPTTVGGHWGYASVGGQLGGFDELVNLGGNSYQGRLNGGDGFGTFANGGNAIPYGNLELYLMGLIGADELEAVQVAVNPEAGSSFGQFTVNAIETYTPQDMVVANGARVPNHMNSQKEFRALTVIISKELMNAERMEAAHSYLDNFSRPAAPDDSWGTLNNFWLATEGKASFSVDVLPVHIK